MMKCLAGHDCMQLGIGNEECAIRGDLGDLRKMDERINTSKGLECK